MSIFNICGNLLLSFYSRTKVKKLCFSVYSWNNNGSNGIINSVFSVESNRIFSVLI